jgi:uncharacterized membrane protein
VETKNCFQQKILLDNYILNMKEYENENENDLFEENEIEEKEKNVKKEKKKKNWISLNLIPSFGIIQLILRLLIFFITLITLIAVIVDQVLLIIYTIPSPNTIISQISFYANSVFR